MLALTLAWLACLPPAQGPPAALDEGAVAPHGRWYSQGGSAARTRQVAGPAPSGELERVWSLSVEGALEGEPVTWDGHVVLSYARRNGQRALVVLDLLTGRRRGGERSFDTSAPLAPTVWDAEVLVRSEPRALAAFRLAPSGPQLSWRMPLDGALGPPLLFEREVYVTCGDALVALELGRPRERWRVPGRYRGAVSLRGDEVYAVRYDAHGNAQLVCLAREDGEVVRVQGVGHHDGRVPPHGELPRTVLTERECVLYHAYPLELAGRPPATTLGLPRPLPTDAVRTFNEVSFGHATWAAGVGAGWIGLSASTPDGRAWLRLLPQRGELEVLAYRAHHPEILKYTGAPSVCGNTAWIAGRQVDLATLRVLARLPAERDGFVVPAGDTALLVEPPARVSAWRRRRVATPVTLTASSLGDRVAVLADGTILSGDLELDREARTLSARVERRPRVVPLDQVQVVVDDTHRVQHAGSTEELVHGLRGLVQRDVAARYLALAADARLTGDAELAAEILTEATRLGAEGAEVERVTAQLEDLRARPAEVDSERARVVRARRAELARAPALAFFQYASSLPPEAPFAWERALLDAVLERDPAHPGARQRVRRLLPEELKLSGDFDAREWLAFADAARARPVEVLRPPAEGEVVDEARRPLARAAEDWRADLVGFRSERLLIVTPVARPGAIARCLLLGELVCEALEDIFAAGAVQRREREPLVIHLCPTREEYLRISAESDRRLRRGLPPRDASADLEWTAGHYDHLANVSRLFVPEEEHAWESVMRTVAHETTHHWLRARCPLFTEREVTRMGAELPGYWVVEGFAGLVEGFRFDLERMQWEPHDARSRRLDLVANAGERALLDWRVILRASQLDFYRLGTERADAVDSRWWLGKPQPVSHRSQFYNQAAALCAYLYGARGGEQRDELLEYLRRFYTGEARALDAEALFGLDAEELGARAVDYARAAQDR